MKKKAFQRALSLVLTIVMFVGLIPTMAFAAEDSRKNYTVVDLDSYTSKYMK